MKQEPKELAQAQGEVDEILSDEQDDFQEHREPVLEIKLYSWTLLVIGLAMLAIGLLAGYLGGPLLARQSASAASVSATPASLVAGATVPTQAQETADTQELMQYLLTQTRHFRGDTNAPVVMIEFSDFQ